MCLHARANKLATGNSKECGQTLYWRAIPLDLRKRNSPILQKNPNEISKVFAQVTLKEN